MRNLAEGTCQYRQSKKGIDMTTSAIAATLCVASLPVFLFTANGIAAVGNRIRYRRVGGIRFLRIGRLQLTFSIARESV